MSYMTTTERNTCASIIHAHAITAGAANAVPIPGLGVAADTVTLTSMAMQLAAVFGASIPESVGKAMAIQAIKKTLLKQPIKTAVKEISKFIPLLGQLVAPAISVAMLEAAGWCLAEDMAARRSISQVGVSPA